MCPKYNVAEGILKLAGVKTTDVVYDLGCGEGRVVIMAGKNFGA
jgi:cyclopropane fatty-acyl-phospholipid synthase-like methyltransferase